MTTRAAVEFEWQHMTPRSDEKNISDENLKLNQRDAQWKRVTVRVCSEFLLSASSEEWLLVKLKNKQLSPCRHVSAHLM